MQDRVSGQLCSSWDIEKPGWLTWDTNSGVMWDLINHLFTHIYKCFTILIRVPGVSITFVNIKFIETVILSVLIDES